MSTVRWPDPANREPPSPLLPQRAQAAPGTEACFIEMVDAHPAGIRDDDHMSSPFGPAGRQQEEPAPGSGEQMQPLVPELMATRFGEPGDPYPGRIDPQILLAVEGDARLRRQLIRRNAPLLPVP
ncbi:hypothetical protein ACIRVF_03420 [Kitasatospora sp. NPDC101157]|uniref:hypothetical protein n=1 Tax=Kitasatospora sp. NPDC101157 TaxID=3364098 RepID=UPI00382949BD